MLFSILLFVTAAAAVAIPSTPISEPTTTLNILPRETSTTPPTPSTFSKTEYITIEGVTNSVLTIPGKTIAIATVPTCIQTAVPDNNGYIPPGECDALWNYYPSFGAALAVACLFGFLVVVHIWQAAMFKKTWCWVIIMATIWEMTAMIFRTLSSKNQQSKGLLLVFQIFILLAPLWVNAFAYMTFARMVHYFHPRRSILRMPASIIAIVFVFLDIASFAVQLAGGSMASPGSAPDVQQKALHIYMLGIGFQELIIVLFVVLCAMFQVQLSRLDGGRSCSLFKAHWGPLLCALYFSLAMITVRIVYRLAEFSSGIRKNSALVTKEAYFYILEAGPMVLAVFSFVVVHPGRVMTNRALEMPGVFTVLRNSCARRKGKELLSDSGSETELAEGWRVRKDEIAA
ncbi:RTA1 domain-containing protein [Pochonia chlamydosporia 170]|uniref:RTA1 domain-containing protein n=1 Tax=Pochonia chlamydosporia 170 TaxID=1380566 RepID=A0A179F2E4_METCM|nr:RTA1 domain-containing protein [Pochonia chlamydosporia 170]OAQ59612.1 RTA1 domain-containing protein [Pochonia chlamydosporia 170]